jgi:hypothetical protein
MFSDAAPEVHGPASAFYIGELEAHVGEFYPEPEMAVFISGLEPVSDAERNELWRQLGEDVLLYQNALRDTDSVLSGISGDQPLQHAQFGVDRSRRGSSTSLPSF